MSPHVRESGYRSPGKFCRWNQESWALESGIQVKESGLPLTTGIQNRSSNDQDRNLVPGIRNRRRGIQNPRLSWIPLRGAKRKESLFYKGFLITSEKQDMN